MGAEFLESEVELKHTVEVCYKARGGEVKTLQIVQHLDPNRRKLDTTDIQLLAKEISNCLREDS